MSNLFDVGPQARWRSLPPGGGAPLTDRLSRVRGGWLGRHAERTSPAGRDSRIFRGELGRHAEMIAGPQARWRSLPPGGGAPLTDRLSRVRGGWLGRHAERTSPAGRDSRIFGGKLGRHAEMIAGPQARFRSLPPGGGAPLTDRLSRVRGEKLGRHAKMTSPAGRDSRICGGKLGRSEEMTSLAGRDGGLRCRKFARPAGCV